MNAKPFSIPALLKEGWELTKINIGFLVVYQIILYAVAFLFGGTEESLAMLFLNLLGFILITLGNMGLLNSVLLLTVGEKPGFDQFYRNWPKLLSWIVAHFLFSIPFFILGILLLAPALLMTLNFGYFNFTPLFLVLYFLGFILVLAVSFYILARFGFCSFFILDKNAGPIESLKASSAATDGIRWPIFLLILALIGLNLLGLLLFVVGLLITIPVTLIALATVYRQITGQSKKSIQPSDIT